MKQLILISAIICFFQFFISSCDLFSIQDTDEVDLGGLNELKETILPDGQIIVNGSEDTMAPFIYRHWFGYTSAQNPIDSLYFLKNRSGEIIEKYAITKLISSNKSRNRKEYLLSNGKYIYVEYDKEANFFVSEFVDSESKLQKPLKRGKYINIASEPDNW